MTLGAHGDPDVLRRFADAVDVITFEFENIIADGLDLLAASKPVRPSGRVLRISQDRTLDRPSNRPAACQARSSVSCTASSASDPDPSIR